MREDFLSRIRKFTPEKLFLSVLHLAASTNGEGYTTALRRVWERSGLRQANTPAKSSLSEYREKVSFEFFKSIFQEDLKRHEHLRKKFRGFYVYAIDGDHLDLPASKDIIERGYRGYPYKLKETHYPRMYTSQVLDLINGVVKDFEYSSQIGEQVLSRKMIKGLEKNSITLYDRLYDNHGTACAHEEVGSYFFVRVKAKNPKSPLLVQEFCRSGRRNTSLELQPPGKQLPVKVRLIKIRNPKTNTDLVFMTNMPVGLIRNKEVASLYQRRWGIESSFKDLTDTLKMCHWHSLKLNGILQEIYSLLWLVNSVRRTCAQVIKKTNTWLDQDYKKPNFKLIILALMDHLDLLIKRRYKTLKRILSYWIHRSIESRTHLSRSYPRALRHHGKAYPNLSVVDRRP